MNDGTVVPGVASVPLKSVFDVVELAAALNICSPVQVFELARLKSTVREDVPLPVTVIVLFGLVNDGYPPPPPEICVQVELWQV